MQAALSLGPAPLGRPAARLCSRSSSFLALQHQRLSPVGLGAASVRRRCTARVAASAAQPLLRAAAPLGRLAVRALPANLLAAAFAAARSGRMNPWIMAGLLVYCVGVTIYATNTRRQAEVAAASTLDATDASASLSSTASASLSSIDSTEAAGQNKKKERSEVCKVCGGTGQVGRGGDPGCFWAWRSSGLFLLVWHTLILSARQSGWHCSWAAAAAGCCQWIVA